MLYAQNYKLKSRSVFLYLRNYTSFFFVFFSTAICDQLNKLYFFNLIFYVMILEIFKGYFVPIIIWRYY